MIARDRVIENEEISVSTANKGFAIVQQVITIEEIRLLLHSLKKLGAHRSRAGMRHLLNVAAVSELANDPRLLGIAQSILGNHAFPFKATLFGKSPDMNWLITWHQDTALPLCEKVETPSWGPWSRKKGITYSHAPAGALEKVVALRLHLDNSDMENGPLRVIPGSHCRGVLTDQEVETMVGKERQVTCMVERGGVIVMRPLIIHSSSKSQSDKPRRVLHIEYATPDTVAAPLQLAIA